MNLRHVLVKLLLAAILGLSVSSCSGKDSASQSANRPVLAARGALFDIWLTDSGGKIWRDRRADNQSRVRPLAQLAGNEWEAFQIVVDGRGLVDSLSVVVSELRGPNGATISAPTLYRQHYVDIKGTPSRQYGRTGPVPDALVPLVHPVTGKATAGDYGGDRFDVNNGDREAFWAEFKSAPGQSPGLYTGRVTVAAEGLVSISLPFSIEVFAFSLPRQKALTACFQMAGETLRHSHHHLRAEAPEATLKLAHKYEAMLHEHSISNWSPVLGYDYTTNGVDIQIVGGKLSVDWTKYDALVEPHMDGSAYEDGVPAQCLFAPYFMPVRRQNNDEWAPNINRHNFHRIDHDLLAQWVIELESHFREKGWLDRAWLFYFDEPFLQGWKYEAFKAASVTIKENAPDLRIMLTDSYRPEKWAQQGVKPEDVLPYVDSWNPVTWQVANAELATFYQQRKARGEFDFWCQTLANANARRAVINLFPEFDMPFHRMWGVMSWNFGFSGIEWWGTTFWYNYLTKQRTDPWSDATAFPLAEKPLNSDGRLFYPGTPQAIGGPDIPISSLRMKSVRDAVEDYEYLAMAEAAGIKVNMDTLHTWNKKHAEDMSQAMPMGQGPWHWWEGDSQRFFDFREALARKLESIKDR